MSRLFLLASLAWVFVPLGFKPLQAWGWFPSFPRSSVGTQTGTLQRAYTRRYQARQVGSIYFCSPNQSKQHIRHSPSGVRRGRRQFFLIVFCRSHASAFPLHSDAGASGGCIPTLERGNDKREESGNDGSHPYVWSIPIVPYSHLSHPRSFHRNQAPLIVPTLPPFFHARTSGRCVTAGVK